MYMFSTYFNEWMALKVLKLWMSFVIHLQATQVGIVPDNIVIIAGINEWKSSKCWQ